MYYDFLKYQPYPPQEVDQDYLLYLASLNGVLGPANNFYPEPIKGNVICEKDCSLYYDNSQICKYVLKNERDYYKTVKYSNLTDESSTRIVETFMGIEYNAIYSNKLPDLDKNDTITIKDDLIKRPLVIDDITTSEGAKLALQESRRLLQEIYVRMNIGVRTDMFPSEKVSHFRIIIDKALKDFNTDNGSISFYERLFLLNIVLATIRSQLNVLDDLFDVASKYKSSLESSLCEEEEAKRQELLGKAKRIVNDQRSLIGNVDDYASLEKKGRSIRLFIQDGLKACQINLYQESIDCQLALDAADLRLLSCKVWCISLGKRDSLKSLSIVQGLVERAFLSNDINEVRRILIALYSLNFRSQLQNPGELNLDEKYIYELNYYVNGKFSPTEEMMSLLWSFNQQLSELLPTLTHDPNSKNEFCRILQAVSSLLVEDIYPSSYQRNFSKLSFVTNLLIKSLKLLIEDPSKKCNLFRISAKVNQILYSGLSEEDIALGYQSVTINALSPEPEIPPYITSFLRKMSTLGKCRGSDLN